MITVIQTNVPRCPNCSALMFQRLQLDSWYYICNDCGSVYKIIEGGQAEIEVTISDNKEDK